LAVEEAEVAPQQVVYEYGTAEERVAVGGSYRGGEGAAVLQTLVGREEVGVRDRER